MTQSPARSLESAAIRTGAAVTPRPIWTEAEEMEHDMDEGDIFAHRRIAAALKLAAEIIEMDAAKALYINPITIAKFDVFTSLCDALDGLGEVNSSYLKVAP